MRPVITAALALLVGAPCAAAPAPKIVELWRFTQPGLDVEAVLPRPDGSVLVAAEFDGPLSLPGDRPLTPAGDDDIALLLIGPDGTLRAVHTLGSTRAEAVHGLIEVDGGPLLAATTRGTLTIGPDTITAPPGESPYLPGIAGLVIALGPDGRPIRAPITEPHAQAIAAAGLPGGAVVVALARDEMRDGPHGAVVTVHAGQTRSWSRPFDGFDLMRLDVRGGRVLLSGGGRNQLRVHAVDPKTGADLTPPTTLQTPFTGDRGGITAIVDGPAGSEIVGHSGRPPVRVESGATESHSIEPFALSLGRPDRDRRQIVDAVASVAAAGRIGGVLATVIDVIHTGPRYGGTSPSHPGAWLTLGVGDTLRTVPIHLRGGGPKTGIGYISPSPGSLIAGERLILMGRCDARGDLGCVVALSLR